MEQAPTLIGTPIGGACSKNRIGQKPGAILDLMGALESSRTRHALELQYGQNPCRRRPRCRGDQSAGSQLPVRKDMVRRYGSECERWWLESPGGLEVGGSGLSATLRDYARFGLFMQEDGIIDGESVLPDGWMADASSRKTAGGELMDYGYMLWPLHDRSYAAIGIFGQFVFVDPDNALVVAMWGAQSKPIGKEGVDEYVFLESLSKYFASK
ncbi:MAG: serine hydrolase [Myxococcota bacterium]